MQESRDPEEIGGVLIWNFFSVRSAAIVRDVGGRGNSTPGRRRASIAPHRVPGRPGRVLLVDSERGVILNRPIVTTHSATRRVRSKEPRRSVTPVGRGAFGILQANRSGRCRLDALNQLHSDVLRTAYTAPIANVTSAITATATPSTCCCGALCARRWSASSQLPIRQLPMRRGLGGAARGLRSPQGW